MAETLAGGSPTGPAVGLADALWDHPQHGVAPRIAALLADRGWHAARTVVLVPYAQLMKVARSAWTRSAAAGFTPRFDTSRSWASAAGGFVPTGHDIAFDMARDLCTAQSLLARAGAGAESLALAGRLVELALQLAPLAAAELPDARGDWAQRMGDVADVGGGAEWFRVENLLTSVALAWASTSAYASDVLLRDVERQRVDALVVLEGYQTDPLTRTLERLWGARAVRVALTPDQAHGHVAALHQASDPEDEAELAAACVLRHLRAQREPVALVATDRALTRRIGAQLAAHGVALHDETGWKLSTTRAAASLMSALRACAHDASSDQVLDWLKNAGHAGQDDPALVPALEARLRREGLRDWAGWCAFVARSEAPDDAALQGFTLSIEAQRSPLARARPIGDWLHALRGLLESAGQWQPLVDDAAGANVVTALWLDDAQDDGQGVAGETRPLRQTLADFTGWVRDVLEAGSFVPTLGRQQAQVNVLPLHQLLGRSFAAVVVPGCDERRLPAAPEPAGNWTAAQRLQLGLPSRADIEAAQRAAWATALCNPACELLWRHADAGGEPVQPSPLVQALLLDGSAAPSTDPRPQRTVPLQPTQRPAPSGAALPLLRVSTSMYEDLRRCPYRFFALRQLGLRSADELDAEIDKRDFGNWLHAVLGHFHQALQARPTVDAQERLAMMAHAEALATQEFGLAQAEFLPFAAAWPAVRDGYLDWLTGHEGEGTVFVDAEPWMEQPLGPLTLIGRLDRIDRTADGQPYVIDYKTESATTTRERVKDPTEDTQLAFYAALLAEDRLRAAYVNVGERASGTRTIEQTEVVDARDALVQGLLDDFRRIGQGAALPPLGEGLVCEHCAARGLCRKDFWADAPQSPASLPEEVPR